MSDRKILILDRDGTIVVDRPYLNDPAGLEFLPGAVSGLRRLHALEYELMVITNQSGVGRGLISAAQLQAVHDRLSAMLAEAGAPLRQIYHCPHVPEANCDCRKPRPGLLERAAAEWYFEISRCVVIGDKMTDVELGRRVGATTVLIGDTAPPVEAAARPDHVVRNLSEAVEVVCARTPQGVTPTTRCPVR